MTRNDMTEALTAKGNQPWDYVLSEVAQPDWGLRLTPLPAASAHY